ncbi:hypothetical protein [Oceanibacterium hippocampi]|uniref:Uncharacterized protein n=1 Tax=Oceanibacterium hippocampi TaxID=745714 RepID=A0A1Y5U610_9PROT|nr:hypothetical protein [Oceanibacterium hippocampi]SLN77669.1 hypothetical protein OCH7691_04497 [Oceanibacterium hippocampi]
MTATFALPFLSLPDEAVTLEGWMIGRAATHLLPMKPILHDWDYAADIELRGSISIDVTVAAKILAIPKEELKLAVVLKIGTGRGRFPRIVERVSSQLFDLATDQPMDLSAIVPGNTLSGRLCARIDVLLAAPAENASTLSPTRIGSRLWSVEFSVELEDGGDNRFPIEVVSFSETFPSSRHVTAPWYLAWRPGGFGADFGGSIRLYVNSDHSELTERVVEGDTLTLQAILGDVMVQIVGAALDAEDLAEHLDGCEEGSVGAQIEGWLQLAFPGRELSEVMTIRRSLPGLFHASIHAAAELGDIK